MFASFSKYFSMTGWRIGWMLVPDRLRRACDVLTGNFTICPPVLAQRACLAAFDDASYAELDGHVRRYADNRTAPARRAAEARHHRARPGRRRVLRLRRRRPPERGHDGLLPRPAGAHRRGDRAGHRLRHRGRAPVRPAQLRGPRRPTSRRRSSGSPQPSDRRFPPPACGRADRRHVRRHRGDPRAGPHHARPGHGAALPGGLAARPRRGGALGGARRGRDAGPGARPGRGAATHRRPARRRRRRPRPARRRGRPAQGADRRDRAEGDGAGRRRQRPAGRAGRRVLPDPVDELLDRFVPPPPGHRDWLLVDLPGLS